MPMFSQPDVSALPRVEMATSQGSSAMITPNQKRWTLQSHEEHCNVYPVFYSPQYRYLRKGQRHSVGINGFLCKNPSQSRNEKAE